MNKEDEAHIEISYVLHIITLDISPKDLSFKLLEKIEKARYAVKGMEKEFEPYLAELKLRREERKIQLDRKFQLELVAIVAVFGALFGLLTGVFNAAMSRLIEVWTLDWLLLLVLVSGVGIVFAGLWVIKYYQSRGM